MLVVYLCFLLSVSWCPNKLLPNANLPSWSSTILIMVKDATQQVVPDGHSGTGSGSDSLAADDKLHFEETATFSEPVPIPTKGGGIYGTTSASDSDEDGKALIKNPFLDPDVAARWAAVYEENAYECRAEFDPTFTWSEAEEKALVRRLDWRVCMWAVCIAP